MDDGPGGAHPSSGANEGAAGIAGAVVEEDVGDLGPGSGRRSAGNERHLDLVLAISAAVLSMVAIGYLARDFWFRFDSFYFLADREIGSFNDWVRPHAGHWTTWTTLLFRGLHGTVGMDYWPWFYLSRLIGHAALSFLMWRVLLRRGSDRLLAAGVYATLLVLAVSYFHDALTVGNYFVFGGLVIAALLLEEVARPSLRQQLLMGACLLAALMGNGYGVAVLLSVTGIALAVRRFRRWGVAFLVPGGVFAIWFLWYRDQFPERTPFDVHSVPDAARASLVVVRTAVENTLGVPPVVAALFLVATLTALGWLLARGRLDAFDAVIATTLVLTLGSLAATRTLKVDSAAAEARYGYAVALLLILLVVPHVRIPSAVPYRITAALALVAVATFNAVSLHGRLNERERIAQEVRVDAETTAALIEAGEPYVSYARLATRVNPRQIDQLVADGWHPAPSPDPVIVNRVRAGMRITLPPTNRLDDAASAATGTLHMDDVDAEGCHTVLPGSTDEIVVAEESALRVEGPARFTWTDRFGTATRPVEDAVVGLATPVGDTTVTVSSVRGQPLKLCGLTSL